MASPVVEVEAKSKTDGAWWNAVLSIQDDEDGPKLRVHFEDFSEDEDEVYSEIEDALAILRSRSEPLEDGECKTIQEGEVLLSFQKRQGEQKYFDASLEKVIMKPHATRGKQKCKCTFVVRWLGSDKVNTTASLQFVSLCRLTKQDVKQNSVLHEWLLKKGSFKKQVRGEIEGGSGPPADQMGLNSHLPANHASGAEEKAHLEFEVDIIEQSLAINEGNVSSMVPGEGTEPLGDGAHVVHSQQETTVTTTTCIETALCVSTVSEASDGHRITFDIFQAKAPTACTNCGETMTGQVLVILAPTGDTGNNIGSTAVKAAAAELLDPNPMPTSSEFPTEKAGTCVDDFLSAPKVQMGQNQETQPDPKRAKFTPPRDLASEDPTWLEEFTTNAAPC
eukprot:jgi/Mesen1/4028/ME000212S03059